jgi:PAS domain S-box-containing protein
MPSTPGTPQPVSTAHYLELALDAIGDYAIYTLDTAGVVVSWNAGAEHITGYRSAEIIGRHFSRFFTPEDLAARVPDRILADARDTGRHESEGWRVRKDGGRFLANAILQPMRDAQGTLIGFVKITRDITDRAAVQGALLESERRFRLLVEGVTDYAIYMLDPSGVVSNWNPGAQRLKGYTADDIVGQHFSRFYTKEDRAAGLPAHVLATNPKAGASARTAAGFGRQSSSTRSATRPARSRASPR